MNDDIDSKNFSKPPSNSDFATADSGKKSQNQIEIPNISLPKGGGALKNIDEKFRVNASNGTASFSIPLPLSKARSDFAPSLSINYNSGSGNSCFGLGWSLAFASIQRKTDKKLPKYRDADESDVFMFTGAEDLVPAFKTDNDGNLVKDLSGNLIVDEFISPSGEKVKRYRPRIEGSFNRIERITLPGSLTFFWRVTSPDNVVTIFGRSVAAQVADPQNPDHIFRWLPEFSFDDRGNCMQFEYVQEDMVNIPKQLHEQNRFNQNALFTNLYLKRVKYGNVTPYPRDTQKAYNPDLPADGFPYLFETVFDFGDHDMSNPIPEVQGLWSCRIDPFSDYHPGFEVRTYRLCQRVLFFHYFKELNDGINASPCLVRSLDMQYRCFNNPSATDEDKRNAETDFIISVQQSGYKKNNSGYSKKSLPPVEFSYQELNWKKTIENVSSENSKNAPTGLGQNYQWLDLWNEGISGILTEQANGWYYKSNLGDGAFSTAEPVIPKPSLTGLSSSQLQLQDLEADGRKFIVSMQGHVKGYFELSDDGQWQPFQLFTQLPNIDIRDPNTKFIDLDGDGKPDLVVSEENVFAWYASMGIAGFDSPELAAKPFDEEKGPALVFSDPSQSIFLADISGDGMTDIVRIRNGDVCYWPNMGYGKFGAKINMSNAPVFDSNDLFNPSYLHLADVSGTGATDILYLGKNQFNAWLNLSGNAWSDTVEIDPFPNTELPNQVNVIDFLGNGTGCIVWSSSWPGYADTPMRYIDLMGGRKPYIMSGYKNNFGKEISWEYLSSTVFYLRDKQAGSPWVTKLPFPVQCVSKANINDFIAGTFLSNSYTYHHGYYDHAEREFRGFGRVEQTDTQDFANFILSGASNVVEEDLHQPPVKTITWFHTGAYFNQQDILNQYEHEYIKGPFEFDLPQPALPEGLTADEYREAFRACKGMTLRQETYAIDNSLLQDQPYSVVTHNCLIELFQPRDQNKYAVFFNQESEAVTYYYERNLNDPRISHSLNLAVDNFGHILQSASVVYGRKATDASLPSDIQAEQNKIHIIFTENDFTNHFDEADAYRVAMSSETKTYELTGISPGNGLSAFLISDLLDAPSKATFINYEVNPDNVSFQIRMIEDVRNIYLGNDLVTPLNLGVIESMAFSSQRYKLAFAPSLVNVLYGGKVTTQMLSESNYVQQDNTNWWILSGTKVYLKGGETISDAMQRFYLPVSIKDAFNNETQLFYDDDSLLLIRIIDPLQNQTISTIDYRTLQPMLLQDQNGNLSEILTDELGMVIATSAYGHESDGNHGDEPLSSYDLTVKPSNLDDVIANPLKFLQQATTFFYYDLFAWINRQQPTCFAGVVREAHVSELKNGEATNVFLSVGYSNGLGKNLQTKAQAEPGDALRWNTSTHALETIDTTPNLRWIGSGRTIFNNKGNPVKQYEPFFSTTYNYESEDAIVEIGFSSVLYYDPIGRNIRTEHPNGTLSRVEFNAWKQLSFDENDTVLESQWYSDRRSPNPLSSEPSDPEARAAWLAAKNANTPAQAHFDSLGRTIYAIADNANDGQYATRTILDIENNRLKVIDARNNSVMKYDYDMISRQAHQTSMDSGERWSFSDAMSKPVYAWDSQSHRLRSEFEDLHRPLNQWLVEDVTQLSAADLLLPVQKNKPQNKFEKLIVASVYGENQPNDTLLNLRGRAFQNFDQSGLMQSNEYDFKGNIKSSFTQLAADYKNVIDWNIVNRNTLIENEKFTSSSKFNAVNHSVHMDMPDGSRIKPGYNEANLLETVIVYLKSKNQNEDKNPNIFTSFVQNIDYNPKAQREKILYGNNTLTNYTYDEKTYRLTRLLTTRNSGADILQDLNYTYDPVGNITEIEDNAQQTIFFNNASVDTGNKFVHDAIYRLTRAFGREHAGQNATCDQFDSDKTQNGGKRLVLPGDMNAMQHYDQQYVYDEAGNMLKMIHNAGSGIFSNKWTRIFSYNSNNNQLVSTHVGAGMANYSYDAHGNMKNLQNGSFNLMWNYADQVQQIDLGGGGTAYYVYDGSGHRVRKVIENGNLIKERIYLGAYEIYRERLNGSLQLERETLHVMDDKQRIALVETRTKGSDKGLSFLIRYQYSNHLGTSCLELNDTANIISYEEYYPFGSSSYQAMDNQTETPKRYRYTGKERDEESGLYYHGARYCAPWLARWVTVDPIGIGDGLNVYGYVKNNPVRLYDPSGTQVATGPPVQIDIPKKAPPTALHGATDQSIPEPGGTADLSGAISVPDAGLTGTTNLTLKLGKPLGDDPKYKFGIEGRFKLTYPKIPPSIPLEPSITGNYSASGIIFPDDNFKGKIDFTGRLRGVPLVVGKFHLREDVSSDKPTQLTFDARVGILGDVPIFPHVSMSGTGISTDDQLHLSGKFSAFAGPGIAWGNWNFDRKGGFDVSGNYIGLQFGPFGLGSLDPRPDVPTSPDDPVPIRQAGDESGRTSRYGTVDTFNPGTSVGYTRFKVNPVTKTYIGFSAGWAWNASITHNDMSRPSAIVFDLPSPISDPLKSALHYDPSSSKDTSVGNYWGISAFGNF